MKYSAVFIVVIVCISANAKSLPFMISNPSDVCLKNDTVLQKTLSGYLSTFAWSDLRKTISKKSGLKGKIGFFLIQHQIKKRSHHGITDHVRDNGKTAFILGLIGLICLVIPFLDIASIPLAILAIVIGNKTRKENPYNKKARSAVALGIISLGLLAIIGLTVAIVLTIGSVPR